MSEEHWSDAPAAIARLLDSPLWAEICRSRDWAMTVTSLPHDFEVFLNPADAEGLVKVNLSGMDVRRSIGVPVGGCLIFHRPSGKYIRHGEHP